MKILRNLKEHVSGLVDCEILVGGDWHPHSISRGDRYTLHHSSAWSGIKPINDSERDRYKIAKERNEVLAQLKSLDATPRLLEDAALGDEFALRKLAEIKTKKEELRLKLA